MSTINRAAPRLALLCVALGAVFSAPVHAQNAGAPAPTSGQLLQQLPQRSNIPASSKPGLAIQQPEASATPAGDQSAFPVRAIEITGNTLLPSEKLHALVAASEGRNLTLGDLSELADRISQAYQKAGYLLSKAYVPAQTLHDGVVRIAVVEARYGQITLQNHSKVIDAPLKATLSSLLPGAPIHDYELERSLLLLSDIPGVQAGSVVRPGGQLGTSELIVDVEDASRYAGTMGVDNFGNAPTGRTRLSANVTVTSPFYRGGLFDLNVLSTGAGMNYGQTGYRYLLNGSGTTLRAAASTLQYQLGHGMEMLHAHGSAVVGSATLSQPLIRNTAGNLYAQLEFDHKDLRDEIDAVYVKTDRLANVWVATLAGDQRDATGITNFNLAGSYGKIAYTDAFTEWLDALGPDTQGRYSKLVMSASRLQQLTSQTGFYAGYSAQRANKNLDTSEQFYLGGFNSVRGYDVGALAGAQGDLLTLELRHDFAVARLPGQWQALGFVDTGHLQTYKVPFHGGDNSGRISSAGARLHWSADGNWEISASAAKPIGNTPALLGPHVDTKPRFWLQVQKGFRS